jgi:hypothetical protein
MKFPALMWPFFQQRFDQVVGFAQADAQHFGKLPLADFGFRLDDFEDTELGLFGGVHGFVHGLNWMLRWVCFRFKSVVSCGVELIATLRGWGWIAALRSQ